MQEIITYLIGAAAALITVRWIYNTLKGSNKSSCGCTTCEGCSKRKTTIDPTIQNKTQHL